MFKGLPVPLTLQSVILEWNKYNSNEIATIFEFSFYFLYDDAHIL